MANEVRDTIGALLGTRVEYEELRAKLISRLGYWAFRDIQSEAFRVMGVPTNAND